MPPGRPILFVYRVPTPGRFAQDAFTVALQAAGVPANPSSGAPAFDRAVAPVSYTPANLLASHVSPSFSEDVYITLKVSDNLQAALLPYMWAIYVAHAKTDLLKTGFAQERVLLAGAGLDLRGAAQQDGLGSSAFFYAAVYGELPGVGLPPVVVQTVLARPADLGHARDALQHTEWIAGRREGAREDRHLGIGDLLNDDGLYTKGLAGYHDQSRPPYRVRVSYHSDGRQTERSPE